MHYTLYDIPDELDRALRKQAADQHKSLDAVIIDLLSGCLDIKTSPTSAKKRDLTGIAGQHLITDEMKEVFAENRRVDYSEIAGTWETDPETEAILEEQNRIDPELWK